MHNASIPASAPLRSEAQRCRLTALQAAANNRHLDVAIALGAHADRADIDSAIKVMVPQDRRRLLSSLGQRRGQPEPEADPEEGGAAAHSTADAAA